MSNIVKAVFGTLKAAETSALWQYDYGQILKIIGLDLPDTYEVHFSNSERGAAKTAIGGPDGVIIPDEYLTSGEKIFAWIFLHTGADDGETRYKITIPVRRRASISDAPPTPQQQEAITQAIAALNGAVDEAEAAAASAASSLETLLSQVGDLQNLETTAKNDVVSAINELFGETVAWVEYGVSTSAEIEALYQAGRPVFCTRTANNRTYIYFLTRRNGAASHSFGGVCASSSSLSDPIVPQFQGVYCEDDVWRGSHVSLAKGADLGDLSALETTDKSNVVDAINEVNAKADAAASDFVATYGTTSWGDINTAYQAGKTIYCVRTTTNANGTWTYRYKLSTVKVGNTSNAFFFGLIQNTERVGTDTLVPLYGGVICTYDVSEQTTTWRGSNKDLALDSDVGSLSDLQTTDKSSIVAAINEVAQGGGGGGDSVAYFPLTLSGSGNSGTATPGTGVTPEAIYQAYAAGKAVFANVTYGGSVTVWQLESAEYDSGSNRYTVMFVTNIDHECWQILIMVDDNDSVWEWSKSQSYVKPSSGIPKTALASAVQTSLGKADDALPKSGGTMTGAIAMGGYKVTGLGTPQNDGDGATKKYVDDAITGIGTVFNIKGDVAAVADLPATGNSVGDVYYVQAVSAAYVWLETTAHPTGYWEEFGEPIDLSGYIEKPTNPSTNQYLKWNGTAWVAADAPVTSVNGQTGAVTLSIPATAGDVGAIPAPSSPSSGDVLTYNGSAWAASEPHYVPAGGNSGALLAKSSASDYQLYWRTVSDYTAAGIIVTAAATAAKICQYSFWDDTHYPQILYITLASANTAASALTLKVNGKGPYPIYINGTASSATNYTLPAGSYVVYFDGTNFYFDTTGKIPAPALDPMEVTVSTAGAVTQALDPGKIYHFTGALTSLTITLNAAGTGVIPQYHFDFDSGSTAPTVTLPNSVTMQGGTFTPEASKHYEVDILNGYGVSMAW